MSRPSPQLPIVAIVGRANVGKSSIFNRLINDRQAIVAAEPGTTRDAVYGRVRVGNRQFALVDTAGLKAPEDQFEVSIQDQIIEATATADCIVVVVEHGVMLTDEDRRVAKLAHKSQTPVILAVNKSDVGSRLELDEFRKLGIKEVVATSATQNQGFSDLLDAIRHHIKPVPAKDDDVLRMALIGRPNVGKSSLFNSLGQKQQAIIADVAGTTRDVNRLATNYHGQAIELLDTAGVRKPGKIGRGIERFSILRTVSAIEESDICVLVLDANEPGVALDQKLAGMIKEAGKGLILAISKWDQIDKDSFTFDQLVSRLRLEFQHVPWAPFTVTSATSGQNVNKLMETALEIRQARNIQLKTHELNVWLVARVNHHPPAGLKNKHPKLRYMTQTGSQPPEFVIFGTFIRLLHWSYKRYLERELRETYGFAGTPVRLKFREKEV